MRLHALLNNASSAASVSYLHYIVFLLMSLCTSTHQFGSDQVYPKRIRLVVDVSGSMYRFNGHDGRLERTLEAALMVMEAFDNQRNFKVCCHRANSPSLSVSPPNTVNDTVDIVDYVCFTCAAGHSGTLGRF